MAGGGGAPFARSRGRGTALALVAGAGANHRLATADERTISPNARRWRATGRRLAPLTSTEPSVPVPSRCWGPPSTGKPPRLVERARLGERMLRARAAGSAWKTPPGPPGAARRGGSRRGFWRSFPPAGRGGLRFRPATQRRHSAPLNLALFLDFGRKINPLAVNALQSSARLKRATKNVVDTGTIPGARFRPGRSARKGACPGRVRPTRAPKR